MYVVGLPTHDSNVSRRTFSQEEMMSEGGDHESWDDEMMMNENNETPLPVVRPIIVRYDFPYSSSLADMSARTQLN